jgi:recombination protein U
MKNLGKIFEENFRKSVPDNVFFYRFRDNSSSFYGGNANLRFTSSNIADNMLFFNGCLLLNELKSHKGKSIPINCICGNKTKEKQIRDMLEANKFYNVFANLIVFFSDVERCFVINIEEFDNFVRCGQRKSIPISFFEENGIEIEVTKKRTNYTFNLKKWLNEYY